MMNKRVILEKLANNEITVEEAEKLLSNNKIEALDDFVKFDLYRENRTGIPEIVYSETKTPEQVLKIAKKIMEKKDIVLFSRIRPEHAEKLKSLNESFILDFGTNSNYCLIKRKDYVSPSPYGKIGIISAGTSDIPVAEEAKVVAEMMGCEVLMVHDVGVAGIHRLFEPLNNLLREDVKVLIVCAGMEGALPTVVAGLVDIPVIGLPVATGYGYGGRGEAALMAMLQTCSLGMAVVNVDAGVSAGAFAAKIVHTIARSRNKSD